MKVYLLMITIFGTKQKNKQSSKKAISYKTFLCHERLRDWFFLAKVKCKNINYLLKVRRHIFFTYPYKIYLVSIVLTSTSIK